MSEHCWICEEKITVANDTEEHVIPNSVGGRKKLKGFVCRACNSGTGHSWDKALSKQLHFLSMLFDVKRQRGKVAPFKTVTTAGEALTLRQGEPPTFTNPEVQVDFLPTGQKHYKVSARNMGEAKSIVESLARKNPELEVGELRAIEFYPQGLFQHKLEFGGDEAGRSIVKSCAALASSLGLDAKSCSNAMAYLREKNGEACFGYYTEADLVVGREKGSPFHCVAVEANPSTGLVLGYVEYFGAYRCVVCLGEKYSGTNIHGVYCVDPRTGREIQVGVNLKFNYQEIIDIYNYKRCHTSQAKAAFESVVGPAMQAANDAERDRVLRQAVERAFSACGAAENEVLTEEHIIRIAKRVAIEIAPYLAHRLRRHDAECN